MTTMIEPRTISASKFKATCLALLDEVARTGRPVVVTKHGRPVAQVAPLDDAEPPSLLGSVTWEGDLTAPIDIEWEVMRGLDDL